MPYIGANLGSIGYSFDFKEIINYPYSDSSRTDTVNITEKGVYMALVYTTGESGSSSITTTGEVLFTDGQSAANGLFIKYIKCKPGDTITIYGGASGAYAKNRNFCMKVTK